MIVIFLTFAIYGIFINALAFAAFGEDKRRAEAGVWRISEAHLLMLALIGGWPGAKLGQKRFRHKTRKQPFATLLNSVGYMLAGAMLIGLFAPQLGLDLTIPALSGLLDADHQATSAVMPHRFGPGSGD